MPKNYMETIREKFSSVLSKYSHKAMTDTNRDELIKDISHLIKTQSETYPNKNIANTLKLFTHPDKIKLYPEIESFNKACFSDSSGLFGIVQIASDSKSFAENDDWESFLEKLHQDFDFEKMLDELNNDYADAPSSYRRQIIQAQIKLVELIIQFQNNTAENIGDKYKEIILLVPTATTVMMASFAPYLTTFMLLNHVVQQMLYNNRVPRPGILKNLHTTLLVCSSLFSMPSNFLAIWAGYLNVFLSDYMLSYISKVYASFKGSLPSSSDSRALIEYKPENDANLNLRMIFTTHEFILISSLVNGYIEKQEQATFPSLWTGTSKAKIMQQYLIKLSTIDRSSDELKKKISDAIDLTVRDLELNTTIMGSGKDAKEVVTQVKRILDQCLQMIQEQDAYDYDEESELSGSHSL